MNLGKMKFFSSFLTSTAFICGLKGELCKGINFVKALRRLSLKRIKLGKKGKVIFLAMLWALFIVLLVIRVHWFHYMYHPRFRTYKSPFSYGGPQLGLTDLLILGMVSVVVGIMLSEVEYILYGYLISLVASFVFVVFYVMYYIWFVLGWGEILYVSPAGFEFLILWGILNAIWLLFPGVVFVCLICVVAGGLLRSWIRP